MPLLNMLYSGPTHEPRFLLTSDVIALVSVTLAFLALIFSLFRWWKVSNESLTKFKEKTHIRITDIEAKIVDIEKSRKDELRKIDEKLDKYQKDNSTSHNQLFENINRNQRDFYNQITRILTAQNNDQ